MRLTRRDDPLLEILSGTGRRMADAVLPTAAFVVVWLVAQAVSWPEPILLGGLALLYLLQAPLAYRMARRLRRSQEEREALLVGALAASDRERSRIAADLHDGVRR